MKIYESTMVGDLYPSASGTLKIGTLQDPFDEGHFLNLYGNGIQMTGIPRTKTLLWFVKGDAEVLGNISARIDVDFDGNITKAKAYAKEAPTGSGLIFDINKNDSTIWSTQEDRLNIIATGNIGSTTVFDTTTFVVDDYFTLDIDAIGSSAPGSDITVELETIVTGP